MKAQVKRLYITFPKAPRKSKMQRMIERRNLKNGVDPIKMIA